MINQRRKNSNGQSPTTGSSSRRTSTKRYSTRSCLPQPSRTTMWITCSTRPLSLQGSTIAVASRGLIIFRSRSRRRYGKRKSRTRKEVGSGVIAVVGRIRMMVNKRKMRRIFIRFRSKLRIILSQQKLNCRISPSIKRKRKKVVL